MILTTGDERCQLAVKGTQDGLTALQDAITY